MRKNQNPALNRDTLYAKSKLYIQRGFRAQRVSDEEEYQLWASLSLELLGKAALANLHPALIADPQHYQSLFAACGRSISADIKTITAKTLFSRLSHLDKAFDKRHQTFCEQISIRRNSELHSGESPFVGMSPEHWECEFWSATQCILGMQQETLESWLGAEESKAPEEIIQKAKMAIAWAVKDRINRRREEFAKKHPNSSHIEDVLDKSERYKWEAFTKNFRDAPDECDSEHCPACECFGFLAGNLWDEEVLELEYENVYNYYQTEIIRSTYTAEEFYCPTCGLKLFGADEIVAGKLPTEFQFEDERQMNFEPDYGND